MCLSTLPTSCEAFSWKFWEKSALNETSLDNETNLFGNETFFDNETNPFGKLEFDADTILANEIKKNLGECEKSNFWLTILLGAFHVIMPCTAFLMGRRARRAWTNKKLALATAAATAIFRDKDAKKYKEETKNLADEIKNTVVNNVNEAKVLSENLQKLRETLPKEMSTASEEAIKGFNENLNTQIKNAAGKVKDWATNEGEFLKTTVNECVNDKLANSGTTIDKLKSSMAKFQEELTSLNEHRTKVDNEFAKLNGDISNAKTTFNEALNTAKASVQESINGFQSNLNSGRSSLNSLSGDLKTATGTLAQLKQGIDKFNLEGSKKQIDGMLKSVGELNTQVTDLMKYADSINKDTLKNQLYAFISKVENSLNGWGPKVETATSRANTAFSKLEDISQDWLALQERVKGMEVQLKDFLNEEGQYSVENIKKAIDYILNLIAQQDQSAPQA